MSTTEDPVTYSKKDFMSDQTIRWCPGCGDYSILSQVQTVLAGLGIPREKFAIISGIGCSSRFPYYMNTYGFHTIHGRAPAVATGLKIANPELSVWIATGDGDSLSIGGNHLIHLLRRNVDVQLLLFNNRIYGLTKGQYSPTSETGKRTRSTPAGSIDHPFVPCALALGADASFVARGVDILVKELRDAVQAAADHRGSSFVEIYQNCNIFNDGAFTNLTDKPVREERLLFLENGRPLLFGAGNRKGIRLNKRLQLEVVELDDISDEALENAGVIIHDETNPVLANLLARLEPPFPVSMGVIYRVQRPLYEREVWRQVDEARGRGRRGDLRRALLEGDTWTVE